MPEINYLCNSNDIIDSRDIIARLEELRSDLLDQDDNATLLNWHEENQDELNNLEALDMEGSQSADDWSYGVTLIRDSYFVRYAQELLEDCGDIPANLPSYIEIDWKATARNLLQDYSEIDYDGVTYYVR